MPSLAEAIDRLIEANVALRKRRALAPLERRLVGKLRRAFLTQGRVFLAKLATVKGEFPPAIREADVVPWEGPFDAAATETVDAFAQPLGAFAEAALAAGLRAAVADLSVETAFDLSHPRAVAYLQQRGGERITEITETTRKGLRTILTQAAEEGWSYQRTAREIKRRYAGFAGPPQAVRVKHLRSRAEAIAVYELGSAYEHGNLMVARDLADSGLVMVKSWGTSQDERVRPSHRANEAESWIPLDSTFSSGDDRPPSDPGCRCYLKVQRQQSSE